ncbi:MAG: hypothetical protein ABWY05_08070 [Noviherbaspirillum sp.]
MSNASSGNDEDDTSVWIVFEEPPEFPNQYVARLYRSYVDTGQYVVGATLNEVRAKLPTGLMRMERSSQDDAMVRESWI